MNTRRGRGKWSNLATRSQTVQSKRRAGERRQVPQSLHEGSTQDRDTMTKIRRVSIPDSFNYQRSQSQAVRKSSPRDSKESRCLFITAIHCLHAKLIQKTTGEASGTFRTTANLVVTPFKMRPIRFRRWGNYCDFWPFRIPRAFSDRCDDCRGSFAVRHPP